jgi:hypothetical protein
MEVYSKNYDIMMKFLLSSLMVCCLSAVMAQEKQQSTSNAAQTTVSTVSFETFCLQHATQIILSTNGKSVSENTVMVPNVQKKSPTYLDYGVTLKENEAQYFLIEGTATLLKVESLYRLRLMYNSLNK